MSKKKTHEQFMQEMKEKGNSNVKIIGHYEGWNIKIECQCNNNSEHKWYATPNNLLKGTGCPICGIREQAQRRVLTNDEFLEKAKENVSPNINILEEYKGYGEKIKCQCKNNPAHIWFATPANLLKGRGCPYCRNEKVGKMFSITEDEFLKRFKEKGNPDELEIIGNYKKSNEPILVRCKNDSRHIFYTNPTYLLGGMHCPYCTGHRVDSTNSLNSLRPDLTQCLKNKEDGDKVTLKSEVVLELKCPNCGFEKNQTAKELTRYGFSCLVCGDNISFPNKFIRNMLKMLNIPFVPEWKDSWTEGKRYDVKFEKDGQNILVEMDGGFHKRETQYKTLKTNQETDRLKNELAKKNGYKLIRINCDISDAKTIFKNIKNSELSDILDLKDFNWKECAIRSSKSILVEICKFYNINPNISMKELGKKFDVNPKTALKYLRKGKEIGLCSVLVKEKKRRNKLLRVVNKITNKEVTYNSARELIKNFENDFGINISERTLYRILKGETTNRFWNNFDFIELKEEK